MKVMESESGVCTYCRRQDILRVEQELGLVPLCPEHIAHLQRILDGTLERSITYNLPAEEENCYA